LNGKLWVGATITASGNLIGLSDTSLNKQLSVGGDASFTSILWVGNTITASGNLIGLSDTSLNKNLFVGGDAYLNGKLWVGSTITASGNLIGLSDTSLNKQLSVGGDAAFNGKLWVGATITASGNLIGLSDTSLNKKLFVGGDASFNGTTYLKDTRLMGNKLYLKDATDVTIYLNYDSTVNGPALYGFSGGLLRTTDANSNYKTSLQWNNAQQVICHGRVAINQTTTPGADRELDVNGNIYASGNIRVADSNAIYLTSTTNNYLKYSNANGDGVKLVGTQNGKLGTYQTNTGATTSSPYYALSWDGDKQVICYGNVSINTGTTPVLNRALDVSGNIYASSDITAANNVRGVNLYTTGDVCGNVLKVNDIYAYGNINLSTTNKSLYIKPSDTNNYLKYDNSVVDGPSLYGNAGGVLGTTQNSNAVLKWNSSKQVICYGNVSINKDTTPVSNRALDVNGNIYASGDISGAFIYGNGSYITGLNLSSYAPISGPIFNGIPKADTASVGTNTTQLATTQFVQSALTNLNLSTTYAPISGSANYATTSSVTTAINNLNLSTTYAPISGSANYATTSSVTTAISNLKSQTNTWAQLQTFNSGITVTGTVTATSFNASSDRRLKSNIQPLSSQWNTILNLDPVSFEWKGNQRSDHGFLAQEVFAAYPVLRNNFNTNISADSSLDEPTDASGNPVYYSIDYGRMTTYLWKGLQETMKKVDQLTTTVDQLTTTVDQLTTTVDQLTTTVDQLTQENKSLSSRIQDLESTR
jgi:outer membrane murein-binding lipoprotein Lpp